MGNIQGYTTPTKTGRWVSKAAEMLNIFPVREAERAAHLVIRCLQNGGKVLACGNGGSATEAQHLTAELVGRFEYSRPALPAIALHSNTAALTAISNDYGYDEVYARQVEAFGEESDVLVAISTSGNSVNVIRAVRAARERGLKVIGYLGGSGGKLKDLVDVPVVMPAEDTATIQAGHLILTHMICGLVEEALFPNRAVFLDRDGTLIVNRHYGWNPDEITFIEGVTEGLRELRGAGYRLVIVSNQSGVARGYFDEIAVHRMHERLEELLGAEGVSLDGIEYCPHHPEGITNGYAVECGCRKPAPGMLRRAAKKHAINLSGSWMVGDIDDDVRAGAAAGARTVLVGEECPVHPPTYHARDFREAVRYIIQANGAARA